MVPQPDGINHSVVLLTYTRPDLAIARIGELHGIYKDIADVEVLTFVNGHSDKEVRLRLASINHHRYRLTTVKENMGFGGGFNEAVKHARGDWLYLLSDDVHVYGDFIARISDRLGCLMPGTIVGQTMISHKAGWNEFGPIVIPYLMGHFYAIRRTTWEQLGGFDADTFYPNDYEDLDLSFRATEEGISLQAFENLPLNHDLAGTIGYNDERRENTIKMRARFAAKHGLNNIPERL